jgi:DNA polymerase I
VAEPGNVLLSADYSQIELRLAAHMADVPQLKEAFARRGHPQRDRAGAVRHGRPRHPQQGQDGQLRDPLRHLAGAWPDGSASRRRRGAGDHRPLFRALPRHPELYPHRRSSSPARTAIHPTLFGRKTWFPRIRSSNRARGAERAAINAPIQGTSADIIKRAMARMDGAGGRRAQGVRMLLQVHDELVFEVPEDREEEAGRL